MRKLIIGTLSLIFLLSLVSCGENARLYSETPYQGCTVETYQTYSIINCGDGSSTVVNNGTNGQDGKDGQNGSDGLDGRDGINGLIVDVINPCGDAPIINDEVILVMADGGFLAYFHEANDVNPRLALLEPNLTYRTTDGDVCTFRFDASGQITYESHNY